MRFFRICFCLVGKINKLIDWFGVLIFSFFFCILCIVCLSCTQFLVCSLAVMGFLVSRTYTESNAIKFHYLQNKFQWLCRFQCALNRYRRAGVSGFLVLVIVKSSEILSIYFYHFNSVTVYVMIFIYFESTLVLFWYFAIFTFWYVVVADFLHTATDTTNQF